MKINLFRTLPKEVGIAFSGGVDSSVLLDIAISQNKKVTILTYHHQNDQSEKEVCNAIDVSKQYKISLQIATTDTQPKPGESKEAFWSKQRNDWFNSLDMHVVTGHNLNDAAEWYLMTALIGKGGQYINYSNKNVSRPLLVTSRAIIEAYTKSNTVNYIVDETNFDVNFNKRNSVRAELLPKVLEYNPWFLNMIKRNIIKRENSKPLYFDANL
jgi:tRNA(Ile)-lysidine synthase